MNYTKTFTPDQVQQYKARRAAKDKLITTNKYDKWFDTRWIGDPGEDTVESMLQDWYGMEKNQGYTRYTNDSDYDYKDFTIPHKKCSLVIDVKTQGRNGKPETYYSYDVAEKQYVKITTRYKQPGNINTLIFCSYDKTTNTCTAIGYLTVPQFVKQAEFRKKGSIMGALTLSTNGYFIPASKLTPFINKRGFLM